MLLLLHPLFFLFEATHNLSLSIAKTENVLFFDTSMANACDRLLGNCFLISSMFPTEGLGLTAWVPYVRYWYSHKIHFIMICNLGEVSMNVP